MVDKISRGFSNISLPTFSPVSIKNDFKALAGRIAKFNFLSKITTSKEPTVVSVPKKPQGPSDPTPAEEVSKKGLLSILKEKITKKASSPNEKILTIDPSKFPHGDADIEKQILEALYLSMRQDHFMPYCKKNDIPFEDSINSFDTFLEDKAQAQGFREFLKTKYADENLIAYNFIHELSNARNKGEVFSNHSLIEEFSSLDLESINLDDNQKQYIKEFFPEKK